MFRCGIGRDVLRTHRLGDVSPYNVAMRETNRPQRGRRWKRTVVMALLLLTGGAIVNVALEITCISFQGLPILGGSQQYGWPFVSTQVVAEGPSWIALLREESDEIYSSAGLRVGLAINTIFYALLLWLLFFAPFAARRVLRRRRGL